MTTDLRALHIERLAGLSNAFKAFGDGPANAADVAALDYAIAALDAQSVQSAYNPGETLSNGAQAGMVCVGWEVEYTDNRWRRYGGKGEPPAYMTRRRRIYAGPVEGTTFEPDNGSEFR